MSLNLLKKEILEPVYCVCNDCKNLNKYICKIYKTEPPNEILGGNPYREKKNKEICKYFEEK